MPFLVTRHQELEGVEGLRGHRVRIRPRHQQRVLLLEDVGAGRLGDDHVRSRLHEREQHVHVAAGVGPRRFDVSAVEVGHAAAELAFGAGHRAVVLFEDGHRIASDLRLVVVHDAGGEERHPVALGQAAAPALAEPAVERLVMEARQGPVAVDAERLLQEQAAGGGRVGEVGQGRGGGAEGAHGVRAPQPAVLPADAFRRRPRRLRPEHQAREVDVEAVRGRVGAVVEAELALPAEVDDPPVVGRGDLGHVALVGIDALEHEVEARAQAMAPAAAVADLGDAG